MSSSIYFYMEVKDKDGKWQMVKYLENTLYECHTKKPECLNDYYYKLKYPFEMRKTIWVGNALRDLLRFKKFENMPDYVSTEVKETMEYKAMADHNPSIDYKTHFSCATLDKVYELYEREYASWISSLKYEMEKEKNDMIGRKITEAKNEIISIITKTEAVTLATDCEDENSESDLDYIVGENLEDLIELREEIEALRTYAVAYTGNKFIPLEDIRLYYYFE